MPCAKPNASATLDAPALPAIVRSSLMNLLSAKPAVKAAAHLIMVVRVGALVAAGTPRGI